MNAEQALKLARRFIELPLEKRRLFLAGLQAEGVAFPVLPIAAGVDVPEREGLSYAQQRMWFLWQLDPASAAYNLPMAVGLRGPVNIAALRQAFEGLVARHETLRTRFVQLGDQVLQRVNATQPVTVHQDDLSAVAAPEAEVERIADLEAKAPFDLVEGPLWRVRLLRLAADHHVLLLTLHHIVADGWSMNVLIEEFVRLYDAAAQGQAADLPPLAIQYRDYALWQRSWLEAGEQARQLEYWQAKLGDDHAPLELPLDHPRPAQPSYRGARHEFSLDAALTERLRTLARQHNVTLFMVLLASFKLLLQRYSGQREVRVGVPIANRNQAQTEGLIGCFINTQVLHTDLDPLLSVPQLLARVRDTALGAQAHQELPFERLVEALDVPRNAQSPLFQVLFNHQANVADVEEIRLASGLSLARMALRKHSARFDLALDTHERGGQLHAAFTYALDLFDEASIVGLGQHWLSLVEALAAEPALAISELARVPAEPVNADATALPALLVPQWIEQASLAGTLAVVAGDQRWSHAELRQRADAVAAHLHAAGMQPDEVVGIVADRSAAMLASIIGVLRAGAAYLPLEPEQPAERLNFMLAGSGVKRVLAPASWAAQLPASVERIAPATLATAQPFSAVAVQPGHLAYVIYTSGTTGQPKAVGISHGALASYLSGVFERLPMAALSNLAMVSTPAADLGHTVLFGALCTGKTLHLLSKEQVLDASAFAAYLAAERIDAVKIVPSHLQALLGAGREALPARCLVLGGEAVPASLLARIHELAPQLEVINHYGPTETTVGVVTAPLAEEPLLGTPLRGVRAAVLDGGLHPALPGVKGELYLGGPSLARGYLGQPALTAERFIPAANGERLYRSGDWVRQGAEGCLHFVGRMDGQVKIRGYRVELAEIEKQLAALPGVRQAAVRVLGEGEARHLAGWLVVEHLSDSSEAALEHLRSLARQRLPEHMLPSHLMLLEHLPVTANGKLDAKALPLPQAQVTHYIAPHTELQTQAAAIWAQVLQVPQVGLGDNFFALGGHSLLATQVVGRLRQQLQLDVPLRLLFDTADLGAFAAELQRLEQGAGQPITLLDRSGPLPLSPAQHRQWLFWKLNPLSAAYNTPMAVRMRGTLDRQALQAAFDGLVARHESLRTRYVEVDEQPQQVIEAAAPVALAEQDLRGQPASTVASQVEAEILATFDLEHGPLLRARLLQVDDDEHLLVMTLHHIASDGWSMGVLVREFAAFYNAAARQQALALPALPVHYADYASWQREQLQGGVLAEQLSYWKAQLEGDFSVLQLPTDRPRPAMPSYQGGKVDLRLPAELVEQLRSLATRNNATLFHVFLAAFALLLSRYSGQGSLNVGVPMTHRNRLELEGLVGFFVNSVVARVKVDAQASIEQFLASVRETALQAQAHKDTPFDLLVDALQPERSPGHNPLFQVMFNHLRDVGERVTGAALEGLQVEEVVLPERTAQLDLALDTSERTDGVVATFSYASDLFDARRIEQMAGHWVNVLHGFVAAALGPVSELPLHNPADHQRIARRFNRNDTRYPSEQPVHRLFEAQVAAQPDATALIFEDRALSYAELNAQANRLAHQLTGQGIGPEVLVGIAVERSLEMVVGILAVLKAGGGYVPLDPQYPQDRLQCMIEDSGIALLLTQGRLQAQLPIPSGLPVLLLDAQLAADLPISNPDVAVNPQNLAYVMFTSGSTGRPKGVGINHLSLTRHAYVSLDFFNLSGSDRVLQFSTFNFDGFVEQLYPALVCGASVVIRGPEIWDSDTFYRHLIDDQITTVDLTTAYWYLITKDFAQHGPRDYGLLRQVHAGGEAMPPEGIAVWKQAGLEHVTLLNTYGPTEATVTVTALDCAPYVSGEKPVPAMMPIGDVLGGRSIYLVDPALQPTPRGVAGEILIGGELLARGYFGRAALTAERFVPDPFEGSGQRLYRTGDLARSRESGVIEYVGRIDHQVKIRGFRIELGEIEAKLLADSRVGEAIVLARESANGLQLVAYVVPNAPCDEAELRDSLRTELKASLPDYMVPAHWLVLERLPLSPNGKLDRKALPAPDLAAQQDTYVAPVTALEQAVAAIWQDLLKVEQVGLTSHFFELGGHSLLAIQIVSRIRHQLERDVSLASLFSCPVLGDFVAAVGEAPSAAAHIEVARRSGPLPLSSAQQRQWILWQLAPDSPAYNLPSALKINGLLDVDALQASFDALVQRHEVLRTTFSTMAGEPQQIIHASAPVTVAHHRLAPDDVKGFIAAQARIPFDLANGPLLRVALLALAADEHILLIVQHHIVSDQWSMRVMVQELLALYGHFTAGAEPALVPLPIQYADYAQWQRQWLHSPAQAQQLAYWKQQLGGEQPVLELPVDFARPPQQTHRAGRVEVVLPPALAKAIRQLSAGQGITSFGVLLASFQALLYRYSGQPDVRVGVPVANRTALQTEQLLGFFVNTQVLRAQVQGDRPFSDLLAQVKRALTQAQANQDLPFEQLVEALRPERDLSRAPLFQVMFNHQRADALDDQQSQPLPGLRIAAMDWGVGAAHFDLVLNVQEGASQWAASFTYATDLFKVSTVQRMAQHWVHLLEAIAHGPDCAVAALPMLAVAEVDHLCGEPAGLPSASVWQPVHRLFEQQAAARPDAVALIAGGRQLSYGELNRLANLQARQLIAKGVGPEVKVGVALERGLEVVVALLAVLKAGGAYVPLDPDYPVDRLAYMIADSGVRLLLAKSETATRIGCPASVEVVIAEEATQLAQAEDPQLPCHPHQLAYIIYTSGSSGMPKGVAVAHGPLAMHCQATAASYEMTSADRELHFLSFAFDGAHERWLTTLRQGGSLLIRDNDLWTPRQTLAAMREHGVTMAGFPPLYLHQLAELALQEGHPPSLRLISFGGDAMPRDSFERVRHALRPRIMINGYGPTECVVTPMLWKTTAQQGCPTAYAPIGQCEGDRRAYVMDHDMSLLPDGHAGELYLGGYGLARGYLDRPGLTAERFVADPFCPGGRLYRTGDRVRRLADGQLEYLGRLDNQVKVRGFRIEIAEIEACLQQLGEVSEVAVVAHDGPAGKALFAYLVPADASLLLSPEQDQAQVFMQLRARMAETLPDYMLPSGFTALPSLPHTPNGKLDRRALPAPTRLASARAYRAPETDLEIRVARIWQEVLKLEKVGLDDHFFELGGHSLLATQVTSRLQAESGTDVPLSALFQATSLVTYIELITPYFYQAAESDLDELSDFLSELETL